MMQSLIDLAKAQSGMRLIQWVAWILLLLISLPVFFTFKNGYGDLLFLEDFSRNVFMEGGDWRAWSMTPSASWIPDVVLYCLGFLVFDNPFDTMYFVSICQILLIYLLSILLVRQVLPGNITGASVTLLFLLMIVTYCSYTTPMWMFFNSTNNHIAPFIMILAGLASGARFIRTSKVVMLLSQFPLVWAGILSGPIFIVGYVYPLVAVAFLIGVLTLAAPRLKPTLVRTALLCLVVVASFKIYELFFGLPSDHFVPQLQRIINSFSLLARDTWALVVGGNPLFFLLVALWAIGVACVVYFFAVALIVEESSAVRSPVLLFLTCFALVLIPVDVAAVIVSGGVHNHGGYRYLMLPIALPLIFLALAISFSSKYPLVRKGTVLFFASAEIAICLLFVPGLSSHFVRHRQAYITPHEANKFSEAFDFPISRGEIIRHFRMADLSLVKCLDDHAQQYGLDTGVAEFWDSRSISLLSAKGLRAYAFTSSLQPLFMMTSIDRYIEPTLGRVPRYNFVVTSVRFPPGHARHLSPQLIRNILGRERAAFVCDSAPERNLVLVYDDAASRAIVERITPTVRGIQFSLGIRNELDLPGRALQRLNGVLQGEVVAAIPGRSGLVTYGPYLRLPPGTYDFVMHVTHPDSHVVEHLGEWDIFTASNQKVHHKGQILGAGPSTQVLSGSFSVSRHTKNLLWEVRTFSEGKARFTVDALKISRR